MESILGTNENAIAGWAIPANRNVKKPIRQRRFFFMILKVQVYSDNM
jgi:hypothetical protein